jgi:subtilisin family serine protease
MGKVLGVAALTAATLLVSVLGAGASGGGPTGPRPSVSPAVVRAIAHGGRPRVVVTLRPRVTGRSLSSTRALVSAAQTRVLARVGLGLALGRRYRAVRALAGRIDRRGLRRLRSSPDVLSVATDNRVHADLVQSVPLIGASQVQALGYTGQGVNVAVLDSGIDTDHPDLADDIVAQACFVVNVDETGGCPGGTRTAAGTGSAEDDEGHGTGVAAVITGSGANGHPKGVAPDAGIVAVKVLDSEGSGFDSDILAGLDWVINERADVDLVNLSIGTDFGHATACDDTSDGHAYASALSALRRRGVLTFAASGNEGQEDAVAAPGCVSSAVSVGAVYDADVGGVNWSDCQDATTAPNKVTCFSNSAPILDLLAPGAIIDAPALGGGMDEFDGTSAATPHAAGVAALLLQRRPDLTPDQLEAAMKQTGVPVLDARNNLTFPRVNALAALNLVATLPPAPGPAFLPDAAATFAEPTGDGGSGPDLGDVEVMTQRGIVSFRVRVANGTGLDGDAEARVLVDADRNTSTGDANGFDVELAITSDGAALRPPGGGPGDNIRPLGGLTRTADSLTIKVSQQELGITGDFAFRVSAVDATGGAGDVAPATGRWSFPAFPVTVSRTGTGSGTVSGGGIACGTSCSTFVGRGESITLAAAAASDSVFAGWGAPCTGSGQCTVIVDAAKTVTARFEALRRLAVAKRGPGGGTISSRPAGIDCGARCAADFANATAVTLDARPAAGSRFRSWSGACTGTGTCRVTLDAAKNVTATFADVGRPTARPLSGRVRRGTRASLRFRLRDNSGRARAALTVERGGRRLARLSRRLGPATGRTYSVRWRVPSGLGPGRARLCVRPVDGSGNAGARSCASLRVL